TTAYHHPPGGEGRPGEPGARGDIIRIRRDALEELQIVADSQVDRQARGYLPLILCVKTDVRIRLRNDGIAEGLRVARVIVDALQEVSQRREGIAAADRARVGNGAIVVKEIRPSPQRVRARLMGKVIGDFVQ